MAALVSAFESASRFEGANESLAQATKLINIVALRCQTFSLVHLLIDYAFSAAIHTAYGDPVGDYKDSRDDARSAIKSGGCCATKTTPPNKTFAPGVTLSSQAAAAPRKQYLLIKPVR